MCVCVCVFERDSSWVSPKFSLDSWWRKNGEKHAFTVWFLSLLIFNNSCRLSQWFSKPTHIREESLLSLEEVFQSPPKGQSKPLRPTSAKEKNKTKNNQKRFRSFSLSYCYGKLKTQIFLSLLSAKVEFKLLCPLHLRTSGSWVLIAGSHYIYIYIYSVWLPCTTYLDL